MVKCFIKVNIKIKITLIVQVIDVCLCGVTFVANNHGHNGNLEASYLFLHIMILSGPPLFQCTVKSQWPIFVSFATHSIIRHIDRDKRRK